MSLSDAFDVARLVEVVLNGKQPIGPILADLKSALDHALKAVEAIEALNNEIQAARLLGTGVAKASK